MKYISLFSGIGGLESKDADPMIICEQDAQCMDYLSQKYKKAKYVEDVKDLSKRTTKIQKMDVVTGGWPCQDLSVAGEKKGFKGVKSVLFYDLLEVAKKSKSETIIAENVPNLLNIDKGDVFGTVLKELASSGYKFIGWRIINSRSFNLPHQRRRLFIVASKSEQIAKNLFNPIKTKIKKPKNELIVNSFYHTAGTHSICFSENFTPTLKVSGGGLAIQYLNQIRRISAAEALKLQGFKPNQFKKFSDTQIFTMAGNAVSKPVGSFIFDSINNNVQDITLRPTSSGDLFDEHSNVIPSNIKNGFYRDGAIYEIDLEEEKLCSNLADFIDLNNNNYLSVQATLGLLRRAAKANKPIKRSLLMMMIEHVSLEALQKEVKQEQIDNLINSSSEGASLLERSSIYEEESLF